MYPLFALMIQWSDMKPKVAIILLTWQRIINLKDTLKQLNDQTYKDFDLYISNANPDRSKISTIKKYIEHYPRLKIVLLEDNNDLYTFRRITLGRSLAEQGYEIVIYIDDDVSILNNHVERCIQQYEPKTYKSSYTWSFYNAGRSYYRNRQRRTDNNKTINYCGSGVAMVDASIFLEPGLFDYPEGALKIEDLWLSYYAQHVLGWDLKYMKTDATVTGRDQAALFRQVRKDKINKDVFLNQLVEMGWNIPETI